MWKHAEMNLQQYWEIPVSIFPAFLATLESLMSVSLSVLKQIPSDLRYQVYLISDIFFVHPAYAIMPIGYLLSRLISFFSFFIISQLNFENIELVYLPNSVVMSRVPCWGTMRKSPSLLYIALLVMDTLHVNTCTAIPCLVLLSPAPAGRRHFRKTFHIQLQTWATHQQLSSIHLPNQACH